MNKEAYYFSHDSNARNDIKIRAMRKRYGSKGYGNYWILIEILRDEKDYELSMKPLTWIALSEEFGTDEEEAKKFVMDLIKTFELLESNENSFWSNSLKRRMDLREKKRSQAREAGRKSAESRRNSKKKIELNSTTVERPLNDRSTIKGKERKVKEKKEKEIKVNENEKKSDVEARKQKIKEFSDQLIADEVFVEGFCMNQRLKPDEIPKILEKFTNQKLSLGEDTWKGYPDFRKNFSFWYPKVKNDIGDRKPDDESLISQWEKEGCYE